VITGPCSQAKFKADTKTIANIESEAHKEFAGMDSFLYQTVKGHVNVENVLVNAFNLYHDGKSQERTMANQDETWQSEQVSEHRLTSRKPPKTCSDSSV
jgi:hypothetical protein